MHPALEAARANRTVAVSLTAAALAVVVFCTVGTFKLLGWLPARSQPSPPAAPPAPVIPNSSLVPVPGERILATGSTDLGLEAGESVVAEPEAAADPPLPMTPPRPALASAPRPARATPMMPAYASPPPAAPDVSAPRPAPPSRAVAAVPTPPSAARPVTPSYVRTRPHPTDPNDPWPN